MKQDDRYFDRRVICLQSVDESDMEERGGFSRLTLFIERYVVMDYRSSRVDAQN